MTRGGLSHAVGALMSNEAETADLPEVGDRSPASGRGGSASGSRGHAGDCGRPHRPARPPDLATRSPAPRVATRQGRFDYLLVESTGISEPLPVAQTFQFSDMMPAAPGADARPLSAVARLDTMVTVVDASGFLKDFTSADSLKDRCVVTTCWGARRVPASTRPRERADWQVIATPLPPPPHATQADGRRPRRRAVGRGPAR